MEFFGGTAQWKHVLITGAADDNLDWTDGWQGKGQFLIVQQYADKGDNGIEADNNAENNEASPRSYPILSNLTLIGVPSSENSDAGILLREGTAANISNAVVIGWNEECVDVDHASTFALAKDGDGPTGDLVIDHSVLSCAKTFAMNDEKDANDQAVTDPWSIETFFLSELDANTVVADTAATLMDPFNTSALDLLPKAGSAAAAGAAIPNDPFFTVVTYKGGIGPDDDWTAGWTTNARN
ncbi:MAG: hypothetical protein H6745_31060 [Deltaproteobacteria bacterium]|nr:hypothetical protein [Deltaproteobacteria bacterium]